ADRRRARALRRVTRQRSTSAVFVRRAGATAAADGRGVGLLLDLLVGTRRLALAPSLFVALARSGAELVALANRLRFGVTLLVVENATETPILVGFRVRSLALF